MCDIKIYTTDVESDVGLTIIIYNYAYIDQVELCDQAIDQCQLLSYDAVECCLRKSNSRASSSVCRRLDSCNSV